MDTPVFMIVTGDFVESEHGGRMIGDDVAGTVTYVDRSELNQGKITLHYAKGKVEHRPNDVLWVYRNGKRD